MAWLTNLASNYLVEHDPGRVGNATRTSRPTAVEAKDEWFNIAVGNNRQFAKLCAAIGVPELTVDPLLTNSARQEPRRGPLTAELQGADRGVSGWRCCRNENVPADPINTIPEVFDDPQVKAREIGGGHAAPYLRRIKVVGSPLKLTQPGDLRGHPPLLGEHTDEILRARLLGR